MSYANAIEYAFIEDLTQEARQHRGWSLALGILTLLVGTAAIVFPLSASVAINLVLGMVLLGAGVLFFIHAFMTRGWKGSLVNILTGLIAVSLGALLLFYPITGVVTLTMLIGGFFFASGIFRTIIAFRMKPYDGWGWLLASGILAFLLGVIIAWQLPEAAGWVLGVLVGIDLIFVGWWLISLSMVAKKLENRS